MDAYDQARDQFLSEEDLDLQKISFAELLAWWDLFLHQAQSSNDLGAEEYSHGVFALPRSEWPAPMRAVRNPPNHA